MMTYLLLIAGFVLLVKGADWLVDGAASLATRWRVSNLVIGLTVVAFGTSAPELFVNVAASLQGNADIAIGNILGSNIANILLILGIAAAIQPLHLQINTTWKEVPFSLLAALAVGVMVHDALIDHTSTSALTRIDGIILLFFFSIFMYYVLEVAKNTRRGLGEVMPTFTVGKSLLMVAGGLAGLVIGGKWIVDSAVTLADSMGVSEKLIGVTVVAIGTSLPELATTVMAAIKKNTDIAVGNVVGSNIFNLFLVLGISSVIKPLPFQPASSFDVAMVVLASAMLFGFLFIGHRHMLLRWQGTVFLLTYAGYLIFSISQG